MGCARHRRERKCELQCMQSTSASVYRRVALEPKCVQASGARARFPYAKGEKRC